MDTQRAVWRSARRLVLALERARPGPLSGLFDGAWVHRAGLGNARRALTVIDRAVADRAELRAGEGGRLEVLTREEALALLGRQSVGRFAYVAREGAPDVVPVNYCWLDFRVLIRSGPGPKLQAALRGDVVAFEVDDLDQATRTGMSAVVVGRATVLDDVAAAADGEDTWPGGPRRHVICITPSRVEGRRVA